MKHVSWMKMVREIQIRSLDRELDRVVREHIDALARDARPTPGTLYHYTDLRSFFSIVESREWWAKDQRCQRDRDEFRHTAQLAREVAAELAATASSPVAQILRDFQLGDDRLEPRNLLRCFLGCFSFARDCAQIWSAPDYQHAQVCFGLTLLQEESPEMRGVAPLQLAVSYDSASWAKNLRAGFARVKEVLERYARGGVAFEVPQDSYLLAQAALGQVAAVVAMTAKDRSFQ
ncbi:MAG: hypothetical protein JNM84_13175 [Planctomycetes bacterium]|nr:hypothetical protein [Planctomycetota bacterium]